MFTSLRDNAAMEELLQHLIVTHCPSAKSVRRRYITNSNDPPKVIRVRSPQATTRYRVVQVGVGWLKYGMQQSLGELYWRLDRQVETDMTFTQHWTIDPSSLI